MGRSARFALIALLLGSAGAAGVVVGPPAELLNQPATWFKNLEYPGRGAWQWLLRPDDDSAVWFYSRQDAVQGDSRITAWRWIEFRDPQAATGVSKQWTGTYLGLVERVEVNCGNPSERVRAATGYHGRNMTDPIQPPLIFDEGQSPWHPAIPGTDRAVFASTVCALFRSHGMRPY